MIFDYPRSEPTRRHGPGGYESYESFRPWLRDEFTFRCVYCLKRERWGQIKAEFDLDHFTPQVIAPAKGIDYRNLLYACHRCNLTKGELEVPDPIRLLSPATVQTLPSGELQAVDPGALLVIRLLDLNSPTMCSWREFWMKIEELAAVHDPSIHAAIVGFPLQLPDLSGLQPPLNTRPEGVSESWFARRTNGILPASY